MNNLHRRFEILCGRHWQVLPSHWQAKCLEFARYLQGAAQSTAVLQAMPDRPETDCCGDPLPKFDITEDGIAIVPVQGMLIKGILPSDKWMFRDSAYEDIKSDIGTAIQAGVKAILLDTDSPGGTCMGSDEAAMCVANCEIPIFAFTEELMCSAAMKVCAPAMQIFATPSAVVGSIGTIAEVLTAEKMFTDMGLKFEVFTGGKFKGVGNPAKDMPHEHKMLVQSEIDELTTEFRSHMTTCRGIKPEFMEGQHFYGKRAAEIGFVDQIVSGREEALNCIREMI